MLDYNMSIFSLLSTDEFKKTLVEEINRNYNIPVLTEETEEKIFTALIETILVVVAKLSNKYLGNV